MITKIGIILRGFIQVAPISASTMFISRGMYTYAMVTSFLISFLWWMNAGSASRLQSPLYAACYGTGAMLGTLCGMWVAGRL